MLIKDNLPSGPFPALGGFTVLALEGADAEDFAQKQFMNDVRLLRPGAWQWNGWLTPKGRVIALFALLRLAPGVLWMILPDAPASELARRLQGFVFRSKVTLRVRADIVVASDWESPAKTSLDHPDQAHALEQGIRLDWGSPAQSRNLWLLPTGHPALSEATPAEDERWRLFDLMHGLPRLDASQVEAWTPQMLSLERLSAFSVSKGCYPGQEIVARTHFLGQSKRMLVALTGDDLHSGQSVTAGTESIGTLVSSAANGRFALAVLSANLSEGALACTGRPCKKTPLCEGLRTS